MRYTESFKSEMVRKQLGPGALGVKRLAAESGVAPSTLWKWKNEAKTLAMTTKPKKTSSKRLTLEQKFQLVLAAAEAGEEGRGALLRREGIFDADLARFQAECAAHLASTRVVRDPSDKKRIKELERAVRRNERALAEAAALVVLSKKVQAYLEADEVGSTTESTEK